MTIFTRYTVDMVRHVTEKDYDTIQEIRHPYILDIDNLSDQEYRWKMQKSGFVGEFTPVEFKEDLHHLFLVDEDKSGILGYLRIDSDREYKDNDKKVWFSEAFKQSYFEGNHAEIGMIGTREDAKRIGVATGLLDFAMIELQKKKIPYLFSIVAISPLTNFPSMMIHEKWEFIRAAVSSPHHHFDMDNYQSILYAKTIQ